MRDFLVIALAFTLFLVGRGGAQTTELDVELTQLGPNSWKAEWPSVVGRTYFMQVSSDVKSWAYCLWIEEGDGQLMDQSFAVSASAERAFVQVIWTDQPIAAGKTALTDDFDGDGLENYDELDLYSTDPLNPDTDFDGIDDKWEIDNASDPNDSSDASADPDGDGRIRFQDFQAGAGDRDSDGVPDGFDADPGDAKISWSRVNFERFSVEVVGDKGDLGDPIDVNDRGDILFRRDVWKRGAPAATALAIPNIAKYRIGEPDLDGTFELLGTETTFELAKGSELGVTFPNDEIWDPIAINNGGAVVGNATFKAPSLPSASTIERGVYWESPGTVRVTNPQDPLFTNTTRFFDITHSFRIIGWDEQQLDPTFYEENYDFFQIPAMRSDLVMWAKGSRPSRIASFASLNTGPPNNVYQYQDTVVGDNHGLIGEHNGSGIDVGRRQEFSVSPIEVLGIARIEGKRGDC